LYDESETGLKNVKERGLYYGTEAKAGEVLAAYDPGKYDRQKDC
jgi:hypothetical protein